MQQIAAYLRRLGLPAAEVTAQEHAVDHGGKMMDYTQNQVKEDNPAAMERLTDYESIGLF